MSKVEVDAIEPQSGTNLTVGASGDTVKIPSGATLDIVSGATLVNNGTATGFASIAWQSSIVTGATHTAAAGQGLWLDTSSNAITLTLPSSPSVGDQVIFTDYARNWGTNAVTLNLNSEKYQGNATPVPVYDTSGESVDIVYSGSTKGWIPNTDGAVAFETQQTYSTDFLVIAGGGGAGSDRGGGAGAGGYRNSFNSETSGGGGSSETALQLTPGQTYTVTVGGGGVGQSANPHSTDSSIGVSSLISGSGITTITSIGGGYGGMKAPAGPKAGGAGGSGGGAHRDSPATPGGAGTSNQGFAGGASDGADVGGGGGGAVEAGNTDGGGYGGDGLSSSITGSAVARGGGGGGHSGSVNPPPGGTGGGGAGGYDGTVSGGVAGTINTGGGGGGRADGGNAGGAGGSGVVILRMATAQFSNTTTGSPTESNSGSDTILVYTGSGSYTA
tara:strand:- start:86 stop:1417 length:1332 start_codon:yes stop_codon:yes gene_type:complete